MKRNTSIKLKAAFLLMVFALNIVVSFACSIGVDMGFNSKHHGDHKTTEAVVHTHNDGIKHFHREKKEKHSHNKTHSHDKASNKQKAGDNKGNCCTDNVKNFQQLDKLIPNYSSLIHPVFFTVFVAAYYNINIFSHTNVVKDIKPFVRSYHPPIPDIRIAIQSFQI